jgi:hypothetical protein
MDNSVGHNFGTGAERSGDDEITARIDLGA